MLDGAARLKDLVKGCEQMGMSALAVTDHGNLFGAYEWYKVAKGSAVKPIIGLEAYLTPKTPRGERKRVQFGDGTGDDVASKGAYTHMTIWAENSSGMHNLFRLSSRSSLEGFFYKPRADRELLHEYKSGLIGTTGCPSGEVQTYLRLGQYDQALASAAEFATSSAPATLRRVDGPRTRHRAPRAARPAAPSQRPQAAAGGHQRPALRARRRRRGARHAAVRVVGLEPRPPTGSSSTATATTSRARPRCAASGPNCPRRATTPWPSPNAAKPTSTRAPAPTWRNFRCQPAKPKSRGSPKKCATGSRCAFPKACPATPPSRPSSRPKSLPTRGTASLPAPRCCWVTARGGRSSRFV
ncbi:MAG: PHP domain-containing protein [Micropruina glycogenica]